MRRIAIGYRSRNYQHYLIMLLSNNVAAALYQNVLIGVLVERSNNSDNDTRGSPAAFARVPYCYREFLQTVIPPPLQYLQRKRRYSGCAPLALSAIF